MNKLQYAFILIIFIISVLCFSTCPAMAGITNGDFSQDPPGYGWTFSSTGVDVFSDSTAWNNNGFAALYADFEEEASVSELSQENIFLLPGDTQLIFDLIMYKSEGTPETDTFTATFGPEQYILLSSDFVGNEYSETVAFDVTGWATGPYTLTFQLENEPDDILTSVLIDNVKFIPAPGALLLAAVGLFSTATSRKLKTKISE